MALEINEVSKLNVFAATEASQGSGFGWLGINIRTVILYGLRSNISNC